jgi:hypothetical protein
MGIGRQRLRRYKKGLLLAAVFVLVVAGAAIVWLIRPSSDVATHTYDFKQTRQPTPLAALGQSSLPLTKTGGSYSAKSSNGVNVNLTQQPKPGVAFVTVDNNDDATLAVSVPGGAASRVVASGSDVSYPQVRDGVNLSYQSYQDHLKEEITLTKPVTEVTFAIDTQKISRVAADAAGGLVLYDNNSPAFYFEPLTAVDAAGQDIAFRYQLQKSGNRYMVTVAARDQAKLRTAQFPVIIDPTISWSFSLASDYTISNFAKLQVSGNVASLINNSGYATDNPYLYTNSPLPYTTLGGFSEALDVTNQGTIGYQFSKDKTTWYWWDGSTWAIAAPTDYNQSNPAATVNSNIASFATQLGGGNLYTKAFFHAASTATPTALDSFTVTYTSPAPTVTSISPNHGIVAGGTNVTLTGTNFTATPPALASFGTKTDFTAGTLPNDVQLADFKWRRYFRRGGTYAWR